MKQKTNKKRYNKIFLIEDYRVISGEQREILSKTDFVMCRVDSISEVDVFKNKCKIKYFDGETQSYPVPYSLIASSYFSEKRTYKGGLVKRTVKRAVNSYESF